jgi:helicase MOV-10
MTDIPEYQRAQNSGYDNHYLTKLVRNYRSHDAILKVPRELFYDGELQPCGDPMILNSLIGWEHLPNKKFPVIFHSVFGKDEREESSPSFFNRSESLTN